MQRKGLSHLAAVTVTGVAAATFALGTASAAQPMTGAPQLVMEPTSSAEPTPSEPSPSTSATSPAPSPTSPSPTPSTSSPTSPTPSTTTPPPSGSTTPKPTPTATPRPPLPWEPPPPGSPSKGRGSFNDDVVLNTAQVKDQIAAAEQIWAQIMASNTGLATALKELQTQAAKANALLESLTKARAAEAAAKASADQAKIELGVLQGRLDRQRAIVREWAFRAYSEGGSADLMNMLDAMEADEAEVGDPLGDLSYLTDQRVRAVDEVRTLTARQQELTANRAAAQKTATDAAAKIVAEKAELDKVVKGQQAQLTALQKNFSADVAKAGPIAAYLAGIQTPEAKAAFEKLQKALGANLSVGAYGKPCTTSDVTYPNGLMPDSARCPLWQAPGESMAPRAAAAFNAMSQEYARQTGSPICVNDSYRSLARQYVTKAKKGKFAATPGRSNHGLGMAVDLCGGIQSFGDPAHLWMKQNAPLYGFFHPSYLGPNSSTPEPWHWEFAG